MRAFGVTAYAMTRSEKRGIVAKEGLRSLCLSDPLRIVTLKALNRYNN